MRLSALTPLLVSVVFRASVHAVHVEAVERGTLGVSARNLKVVNKDVSPDGFSRKATTMDGKIPGTLITGKKGDRFKLNVEDKLTDATMHRATSIHWHGLLQAHTAQMDGPAFVTQCPITPGRSFLYNFEVPDQAGTFWYHSHLSTQYCDGLSGPFVIYDPHDPHKHLYDIDDESTVITLQDWYHNKSTALFPNTNKAAPAPDTTLINGLGRWAKATGDPTPISVVKAKRSKRHRFRIVNMACFPSYKFSIDGHRLTIIETDGVETEPHTVDQLDIFPGQRYSVIVEADQPVGNYWIRAIPGVGNSTTAGGVNSAILRYNGAPKVEPTSSPTANGTLLNEANLHALVNPGAPGNRVPGGADVNINLLHGIDAGSRNWTLGGHSFYPPSVPVLLQILSGQTDPQQLLPPGAVIPLPPNKTIEVSLPGGGNHPFHLHGHTFDVVRTAGSSEYNYENPVRRDVLNIGTVTDNVTFRFTTDNAGPWFLHCHVDWHMEAGLALVFAEDIQGMKKHSPPSSQWNSLCPTYNKYNPDTKLH